jgi:hypothetical protein
MKNRLTNKGIIHLAGTPIIIHDRTIQRCLICGCKLLDSEDPIVNVVVEEGEARYYTWDTGSWVCVSQQSATLVSKSALNVFKQTELPPNNCLALVE